MFKLPYIVFIVALLFLESCSIDNIMMNNVQNIIEAMDRAVHQQKDVSQVREGLPAILLQMDGFIEMAPENRFFMQKAAELHCLFGMGFLEQESESRALLLYEKGEHYAFKSLLHIQGFLEAYQGEQDRWEQFLKQLQPSDVPAIFWLAQCMIGQIRLSEDSPHLLTNIRKIETILQRVIELDEKFYFAGAHLFWGIYLAKSKTAGGDWERSRIHFDRLFQLTDPKYLMGLYYFAESYCVQTQDEALFSSTLQRIIDSDASQDPTHLSLVNQLARKKASLLLSKKDDLFISK